MKRLITILITLAAIALAASCGTASKTTDLPLEKRTIFVQDHADYYPHSLKLTEQSTSTVLDNYLGMTRLDGAVTHRKLESVTVEKDEMTILYHVTTDRKLYQISLVVKDFEVRNTKKSTAP